MKTSSLELEKGFKKHIEPDTTPQFISSDFISSRDTVLAKHNLKLILRTKDTVDPDVSPVGLIKVLVKNGYEKQGKLL